VTADPHSPQRSDESADPLLEIEVLEQTISGHLALKIAGELDVASVGLVEERMQKLVDELEGPLQLTLDLGALEFMDSSGLRLLLRWSVTATEGGGGFAISAVTRDVRRAIEIAGIDESLRLPSED
jgi:stage II sporulation protein AA (anti-sigma F factor antagonist)